MNQLTLDNACKIYEFIFRYCDTVLIKESFLFKSADIAHVQIHVNG